MVLFYCLLSFSKESARHRWMLVGPTACIYTLFPSDFSPNSKCVSRSSVVPRSSYPSPAWGDFEWINIKLFGWGFPIGAIRHKGYFVVKQAETGLILGAPHTGEKVPHLLGWIGRDLWPIKSPLE